MKLLLRCPKCNTAMDLVAYLAEESMAWMDDGEPGFVGFMQTFIYCPQTGCDGAWVLTLEPGEMRTLIHPEQWPEGHPHAGSVARIAVPLRELPD